ncbi:MAG: hypothetical protein Q9169_004400 [Polycauliona sp. 2 TL-2023]
MASNIIADTLHSDLDSAICLLALITTRPTDIDETITSIPCAESNHAGSGIDTDWEPTDAISHEEAGEDPDGVEEPDTSHIIDVDLAEQQDLSHLQDMVLDRLAETLARFKSEPKSPKSLDAKHVSAAMMIVDKEAQTMTITCAKNEGLDKPDSDFLSNWSDWMKRIARQGYSGDLDVDLMFDLVFQHQRPRITYYLARLRRELQRERPVASNKSRVLTGLTASSVRAQLPLKARKWTDNYGLEYSITLSAATNVERVSNASITNGIFQEIDRDSSKLVAVIEELCIITRGNNRQIEDNTVKQLMLYTHSAWQGLKSRSTIKARLHDHFGDNVKRTSNVMSILLCLAKIYRSVHTFVTAAERIGAFKGLRIVQVTHKPSLDSISQPQGIKTPLEAARHLHLTTQQPCWKNMLAMGSQRFGQMLGEKRRKRHIHAEAQILRYYHFDLTDGEKRQGILSKPYPPPHLDLLAQSSHALSTAHFVPDKEEGKLEKSTRDIPARRMMMMPSVANDRPLINKITERPGYAMVVGFGFPKGGKEVTLGEAELLEIKYTRSKLGLEPIGEMPPMKLATRHTCKYCRASSGYRCSKCRTAYCSVSCQRKDWRRHVFVCCIPNRPNHVDYLVSVFGHIPNPQDIQCGTELFRKLFSDDDLCRSFRFDTCVDQSDVVSLFCIYLHIIKTEGSKKLNTYVDSGLLDHVIRYWIAIHQRNSSDVDVNRNFVPYYFSIPTDPVANINEESQYLYQKIVDVDLEELFGLDSLIAKGTEPSISEKRIISLYMVLLREYNNIPGPTFYTAYWLDFGFCFCTNNSQRETLAKAYLDLARSSASLPQIAGALQSASLDGLMKTQGIDISMLESQQIHLRAPTATEVGIYRFIAEVKHALSGSYCPCSTTRCFFHSIYESYLSLESESNYGFHGTNTWERWQLLNLYAYVFDLPAFDPRAMQDAKRDRDPNALEKYLDRLVPDFKRKIGNFYLADVMFPKLRSRLEVPNDHHVCECVFHDVCLSEGMDRWVLPKIALMRDKDGG